MLAVLALLVVALLAGVVWSWQREPRYEGKRLSEWLRQCDYGSSQADDVDPVKNAWREEAGNAVRKIGLRALPGCCGTSPMASQLQSETREDFGKSLKPKANCQL